MCTDFSTKGDVDTSVDPIVSTIIDYRNGNEYKVVTIGDYTWMAEDLEFKSFETPSSISFDLATVESYCPEGWRLPTKETFLSLFAEISKRYHTYDSTSHIYPPYETFSSDYNNWGNYLFSERSNPYHLSFEMKYYLWNGFGGVSRFYLTTYDRWSERMVEDTSDIGIDAIGIGGISQIGTANYIRCVTQELPPVKNLHMTPEHIETLFNYTVTVNANVYTKFPNEPLLYYWDLIYKGKNSVPDPSVNTNQNFIKGNSNGTYTFFTDPQLPNSNDSHNYWLYIKVINHVDDTVMVINKVTVYDSIWASQNEYSLNINIIGDPL